MFDLEKFTAMAAIGAFAFSAAATTYAAVPQQKELPKAEQPAPQLKQDQKDKLGAREDVIQIDQMGDYDGKDQKDIKDVKDAKDVKDVDVKDIKDAKDVKETKGAEDVKDAKGQQARTPDVKVIPVPQDKKTAKAKDAGQKAAPQDSQKVTQPEHK